MADEKEAQEEIVFLTLKEFDQFKMQYVQNMQSLNRVLSTYEDEITSLKAMVHDLSYKLKTLQQTHNIPNKAEE